MKFAIIGAGLFGRLLAIRLIECQHAVTLYDRDFEGAHSAGRVAAGMVAPYSELMRREPLVHKLGAYSLKQWPQYTKTIPGFLFKKANTLWLSHIREKAACEQVLSYLRPTYTWDWLPLSAMQAHCAAISRGAGGTCIEGEGYVNPTAFYNASLNFLKQHATLSAGAYLPDDPFFESESFDWVIDARGLGAQPALPHLRGVRGESLILDCPVSITDMIRFYTPHGAFYLVPQGANQYLLGATEIESAHETAVSVQSYLFLLTTLISFMPVFQEAAVTHVQVGLRPVLPNGLPFLSIQKKHIQMNGLSRHGYLLAPFFVDWLLYHLGLDQHNPAIELTKSEAFQLCNVG